MMPTCGAGPESGRCSAPLLMPGKTMYCGFDCADAVPEANNVAMPIVAAKAPASVVRNMTTLPGDARRPELCVSLSRHRCTWNRQLGVVDGNSWPILCSRLRRSGHCAWLLRARSPLGRRRSRVVHTPGLAPDDLDVSIGATYGDAAFFRLCLWPKKSEMHRPLRTRSAW
jgi:hypothetical protein